MAALVNDMRMIARLQKGDELRFISHLDLQRLLQRALRRASLPVKYSQGFNPHPLLSFSSALSVGYTSSAEWIDIRLEDGVTADSFRARINAALPRGLEVLEAREIEEGLPTLTALITRAGYRVRIALSAPLGAQALEEGLKALLSGEILVEKRTKGGMKTVDIRPMVLSASLVDEEGAHCPILKVDGVLNASGGLPMELFMQAYLRALGAEGSWRVHRVYEYFDQLEV